MAEGIDGTTELTVSAAAPLLEGLFSDIPEDQEPATDTPDSPAPEAPEGEADTPEAPEEPPADAAPEETAEDPDDTQTDEEGEDAPEEPEAPPVFTVKVDGVDVEVTQEELLKGYSRTADYTRKTQALADQRKAFEQEAEQVRAERAQYAESLAQLRTLLEQTAPAEPDWEKVKAETPEQFPALFAEHQLQRARLEQVKAEEAKVAAQRAEDQRRAHAEMLAAEQTRLKTALPEWQDPAVQAKETADLVAYARDLGFAPEDLAGVTDHRVVLMLRKAMLFDHAQAKAKATPSPAPSKKPAASAPVKPGPAPVKSPAKARQEQMRQLRQTGDVQDAARILEDLME